MRKLALLLFILVLLAACGPAATPEPTSIPPTEPSAPTPTAAPVETLAGSVNDLVGIWWFSPPGVKLEFKADGTSRIFFQDTTIDEGNYTFDAGKITWATGTGCKAKPATYETYVTKQDGIPVSLRMQVVGSDPCLDRANVLASKGKFQTP